MPPAQPPALLRNTSQYSSSNPSNSLNPSNHLGWDTSISCEDHYHFSSDFPDVSSSFALHDPIVDFDYSSSSDLLSLPLDPSYPPPLDLSDFSMYQDQLTNNPGSTWAPNQLSLPTYEYNNRLSFPSSLDQSPSTTNLTVDTSLFNSEFQSPHSSHFKRAPSDVTPQGTLTSQLKIEDINQLNSSSSDSTRLTLPPLPTPQSPSASSTSSSSLSQGRIKINSKSTTPQSPVSTTTAPSSRIKKRTLNTEAARRYRQRRVDQVSGLETELKETQAERDALKNRVARLEGELDVLRRLMGTKI